MVSESFSQHWPLSGLHSVFSHLYLCMFHQCHLSLFPKEFMPVVFFIVIMWFNSLYINCWSVNTKKIVIFKKTLLNALGRFKRDVVQKKTTVYLVVFMTSVKTRRILHSNCFKISFHFKEPKTRNEIVQSRCQGDTTGWDLHNVFGLCQQISKRMCVHLFAGGVYVYTFFFCIYIIFDDFCLTNFFDYWLHCISGSGDICFHFNHNSAIQIFIAALWTVTILWREPNCLLTDEWIRMM